MDAKEDDDMTLAEREQWLRDRGVLIENPNDNGKTSSQDNGDDVQSILKQMSGLEIDRDEGSAKFVWVPQDESKALRTFMLPGSVAQKTGDCMPDYVKPFFADRKSIDTSLLQQQATKHFASGQLKDLAETNISTAAMNSAAAQGSVETFPLVHPAESNQFTGVYIYLDEVGLLKKLPNNVRASQIAAACGYHPAPNFYGDVFIGRVKTKPMMRNIDFIAGVDTERGAEWMRRAVSENVSWQQSMNDITGKKGETQPAHVGTDGNAASEEKFQWTQDEDEIELSVPFESAIDKSKVKASFLPRTVKVKYNGEEHLSVQLYGSIDVDGCTWTIDGQNLVLTCEKADAGEIWPRVQESS